MAEPRRMPTADLVRDFTNGDQTSWPEEIAWIREHHPRRLARITREIEGGNFPPIRLCFDEKRVVDGHHRIVAALDLELPSVPVADAWDSSAPDWGLYASDSGADDPEPDPAVDPDVQAFLNLHAARIGSTFTVGPLEADELHGRPITNLPAL